jgi:hypothetical protein
MAHSNAIAGLRPVKKKPGNCTTLRVIPTKSPDPTDIDALMAIESAQNTFDDKLKEGFKNALDELENLGYPGFSNPKITICCLPCACRI